MIDQNLKHPNYNRELEEGQDVFKPEFKRDTRGRYFMQLPGYGKWMVGVEPGSKIISQGSESESGSPATAFDSLMTGTLNVETVLNIGDSIQMNGATGCIILGDPAMGATRPWMSLCGDGIIGHSAGEDSFAFYLQDTERVWNTVTGEKLGAGDLFFGGISDSQFVLWNNSDSTLYVFGTINATAGEIGGWTIGSCLSSTADIGTTGKSKIEMCAGDPGHIQVAYSPSGVFSIPGDIYMVQMTQGSTADPGGIPVPRFDVYRDGVKRAMFNSDGLYFFESDGTTIATSILSGATNEEILNNAAINAGDIAGGVYLPNAQTILSVTAHVIDTGNAHNADLQQMNDAQDYMARMDLSIDALPEATYIGYIWTHALVATSPGTSGVVLNAYGIKGYDSSNNLRFLLNATNGDFYFGDYPSGNSVAWDTSAGSLVVRGEIRALSGYIGGDTSGWKIESNVMQAWSGGTKIIELSSTGPHIQCLKDSNNYVQMTPASSDPRLDVYVSGNRRVRLNSTGLTFYTSGGSTASYIGVGTADGDVTFGAGNVRIWSSGIRVSYPNAINMTASDGSWFRLYCTGAQSILESANDTYGIAIRRANGTTNIMTFIPNQIKAYGNILPFSNHGASLGSVSLQWDDLYAAGIKGDYGHIYLDQPGRIQVTNHFDPTGKGAYSLGGDDRYWENVHCVAVVTHSLVSYDNGIELLDGTKVSDLEAIRNIKESKNVSPYGAKYLDKETFPKDIYMPAKTATEDIHERIEERTEDQMILGTEKYTVYKKGEKVGDDGVNQTLLISLMLGAMKQLDNKVTDLESKLTN